AGVIRADGETGAPGVGFDGDAPGGGGGGGAVLLAVGFDSGAVVVSARGGTGGLQDQTVDPEAEGPGGGGGGGFVAVRGAPRAIDLAGGAGGLTNASGVVQTSVHNGATGGGLGRVELVDDAWAALPNVPGTDGGTNDAGTVDAGRSNDAGATDATPIADGPPATEGGAADAELPHDGGSSPNDAGPSQADDAGPSQADDAEPPPSDAGASEPTDAGGAPNDAKAAADGGVEARAGGNLPPTSTDASVTPAVTVTGGACAAAPGRSSGGWPIVLGLFFVLARGRDRRRARLATLGAALAGVSASPSARAQTAAPDAFSAEWLRLPTDPRAILDTPAEVGTPAGSATVGVWGGWASDPLVERRVPADATLGAFVKDRVDGGLGVSVGLARGWAAEADLPVVVEQRRDLAASPTLGYASRGLGDLRLALRVTVLEAGAWSVVLTPAGTVPTARGHSFLGEAGPTFAPDVAVARTGSRVRAALDGTWRARREIRLGDLRVDDDVALRAGAAVRLGATALEAQGSVLLAFAVDRPFAQQNRTQSEAHLGLAGPIGPAVSWVVGGGLGLLEGWGIPRRRAFAGVRGTFGVVPRRSSADRDGDGILDAADTCPDAPEDRDGFQDDDGCPDPDNDGDGIPDVADRCPNAPETRNGLDDEDGCPDWIPDRDEDGIPDAADACPTEPEDRDGFQDGDGCPELDDDGDGVWDVDDACPRRPGPAERDGCPVPVASAPESCGERLALLAPVYFRTDDAALDATARAVLREVLRLLAEHPAVRLRVEGHTDADGGIGYNDELSLRRVLSVETYLVSRGVASERLMGEGRGLHAPAADNVTPVGKALNRRVVFEVLESAAPTASAAVSR
ncbi:MAG TPA: OmpA family protein, partial [Polyangia bacterium]|nr:OmpA family protein [Polyangia bacterium]